MAKLAKVAILSAMAVMLTGCFGWGKQKDQEVLVDESVGLKEDLLARIERKYENPDAHYKLGKLYQTQTWWSKAESEFHIAVGFAPSYWRADAAIVRVLEDSGQTGRSELAAEHSMNRAAVSAKSSLLLGQAFQKENYDQYAYACYQQALAISPDSAVLNKKIGYYHLTRDDKVRAEEYFRRSFQIDPYQPDVAGELGRMNISIDIPRRTEENGKKLDKQLQEKK